MSARMVSAEEARNLLDEAGRLGTMHLLQDECRDLAHTVVQQAQKIDGLNFLIAAIAQDWGDKCCDDPDDCACTMGQAIRLARALGVTE